MCIPTVSSFAYWRCYCTAWLRYWTNKQEWRDIVLWLNWISGIQKIRKRQDKFNEMKIQTIAAGYYLIYVCTIELYICTDKCQRVKNEWHYFLGLLELCQCLHCLTPFICLLLSFPVSEDRFICEDQKLEWKETCTIFSSTLFSIFLSLRCANTLSFKRRTAPPPPRKF